MRAPRSFLALIALSTLAAFVPSLSAGGDPGSTKKRLTAARCERLVEQLVSPDKPPFTKSYVFQLPKGVSELALIETQAKIKAAYDELSDNIEVALPALAKHVEDERFSYVYQDPISGVYLTDSVGDACSDIIVEHVEVYRKHVTSYDEEGRQRSLWFIEDECRGIDKWWKSRKGKTLAELQLEGIEWALGQKKPAHFTSNKKWAAAKKALKKLAEDIRASQKPILAEHHIQFFSK